MSSVSAISAGGLVLDIGGGLALASAFMFKGPRHVVGEAGSYVEMNPVLLVSLAKQTADAWIGGTLLAMGFGAQLAQAVGARPDWATLQVTIPIASGILVIAGALLFGVLRPWNVARTQRQQLMDGLRRHRRPDYLYSWRERIIHGARSLGREIQPGERPADLAVWALGQKRWAELTEGIDVPEDVLEPYAESPETDGA